MLNTHTDLTQAKAYGGAPKNQDHPAWNMPPGQAYRATRAERLALYKRASHVEFKAHSPSSLTAGVAPQATTSSVDKNSIAHAVKSPQQPNREPKTLPEIKVDAATALTAAYKRHGSGFRIRVQSPEQWESEAKALSVREGCDFMEAMFRAGFVHSYISFPPVGHRAR